MLRITNSNSHIVPCTLLPFSCTLNAQILIPSTNQISFERTVDTAYMLDPPVKIRTFADNATISPTAVAFTLLKVGVTRKIKIVHINTSTEQKD